MADTTAEKLQNMNIQDFDGSEFDPFSPNNQMTNMDNGGQDVDLLGGFVENGQMSYENDKHVSFDHEAGIGLPDPSQFNQGQDGLPEVKGQKEALQRNMSEGEILGYQNEYGETCMTGQEEYTGDDNEEEEGQDNDNDSYPQGHYPGQGHLQTDEYSSHNPSQPLYEQYVENDYPGDNGNTMEEPFDSPVDYDNQRDAESWRPEMTPERSRRSVTPERSMSRVNSEVNSESERQEMTPERSRRSTTPERSMSPDQILGNAGVSKHESSIPQFDNVETPDLVSQSSQLSEETESIDSRSETESTPRRRRIPKPKKPLELPPWDDNVVIPKPPRMKPTLIGKQADLPPPSPPRFHRPFTAPSRPHAKDASSDSGVEDESRLPRKSSGDMRKKYGIDTKNAGYKPGGGNIQVFSQKIDTKSITPRTDTTKPKSALSPRISPSKERTPTPRVPTPNTRNVQSKIGSLNNVKHSPGGGNVKVLNAKVDFTNVHSKVGSKDKINHKPKGGDKKIETQKLTWQTESKVGSLKNVTHSPGGGNLKDGMIEVQGTMNTRENIHYQPGGRNIPDPYEEDLDWDVDARVNTLDNLDYEPGGGIVKIFNEKLNWKAEPKVDTGLNKRGENIPIKPDHHRYDSSKQKVSIIVEPVPEHFTHSYLETVPEVEYHTAGDVNRNRSEREPIEGTVSNSGPITDEGTDQTDGSHSFNDETNLAFEPEWEPAPTPPPKPPRCIHKHWDIERIDMDRILEREEREILTFTKEELDEILRRKELDDYLERENDAQFDSYSENLEETPEHAEKSVKENQETKSEYDVPKTLPISDIASIDESNNFREITNEVMNHLSVYHTEETIITEKEILEKYGGKENADGDVAIVTKPRRKSFVNKMKSLFSPKSKSTKADKQKRFSNTSYEINRSNSNSSRISVKGKKLKNFAQEEEKEIELMVKYLGYHSPRLARKVEYDSGVDQENEIKLKDVKRNSSQKGKKKIQETVEKVEKLANLGYDSPKLSKKGGKPIVMTGSPTHKRKIEVSGNGVIFGDSSKVVSDGKDRVDKLGKDLRDVINVKDGINSDYQDIEFGANITHVGNGRSDGGLGISSVCGYSMDKENLLNEQNGKSIDGFMNEGYEYDDVASEEDSEKSDYDNDKDSEDERHTSIAEVKVKGKNVPKKGIQTTTFKFKMDKRPTSPLHEIKQEMIDYVEEHVPSMDDKTDYERKSEETIEFNDSLTRAAHDKYGYAIVSKTEDGTLEELKSPEVVVKHSEYGPKELTQLSCNGVKSVEVEASSSREKDDSSNTMMNTSLKRSTENMQKIPKLSPDDSEHDLTLEEDLRTVLAFIQDYAGTLEELKTPEVVVKHSKDGHKELTQLSYNGVKSVEVEASSSREKDDSSNTMMNTSLKRSTENMQKIPKLSSDDSEHELTFEEELRTVLANIQDNAGTLEELKSPEVVVKHNKDGPKELTQLSCNGVKSVEVEASSSREKDDSSNTMMNTSLKRSTENMQKIPKLSPDDSEHEFTLEEELRTVLANIQSYAGTLEELKSPEVVVKHSEDGHKELTQLSYNGVKSVEVEASSSREKDDSSNTIMNASLKRSTENMQKIPKLSPDDSEHELTLEEELRTVLANIQDNDGSFLRSPRRYEGTETGSRPGTPKISVKPLWMKAAEEGRESDLSGNYGLRRYTSDENLSRTSQHKFGRANRTQSMMVKKPTPIQMGKLFKAGSGPIREGQGVTSADSTAQLSRNGSNVSRSFKMIYLSGSEQWMTTRSVDDLRQDNVTIPDECSAKYEEQFQVSSENDVADMVVNQRLSWSAKSRIGSLDNATHSPGGGNVKILDQKVEIKAQSKVGSTANLKHKPGGGDKKIETQKLEFKDSAKPKVGSMDKVKHVPGGGDIRIFSEAPKWETSSRVKSLENAQHVPGGGSVKILDEKVDFTQTAKPKVGSMDKVKHQPGGGDKRVR